MRATERKARVLLAVSPRAAERMSRILQGLEVRHAASLGELTYALRCGSFNLVVVGCHFDGSRAIDAVRTALLNAPEVPLACVLAAPFESALGGGTLAAFQAAAGELGVDCFIDVMQFPDDAAGNARVRSILERLAFVT